MSVVSLAAAHIVRALPRRSLSEWVGSLCSAEIPPVCLHPVLAAYRFAFRVDDSEVCPHQPPFRSFDAFFTRRLRTGARPIEGDGATLVSPADGELRSVGDISSDPASTIHVKGQPYTLAELTGDPQLADDVRGGGHLVVYLSPRDYHRVHAPCSGRLRRVWAIEGDRYPVNPIGERHVPQLLIRNRRVVLEIDGGPFRKLVLVMVGAMFVGRMTVTGIVQPDVHGMHRMDRPVERGDELGQFHLGSTVVVLIPPEAWSGSMKTSGRVRCGQALARARELAL